MIASKLCHFPNVIYCLAGQIPWHKEGIAQRWELAPRECDEVGIYFLSTKYIAVQWQQGRLNEMCLVSN